MLAALDAYATLGLLAGALSSGFWTLTYLLIIRQGRRDRTYGMPLPALGANLSWELIFLVVTLAHGVHDARLAMLLPWTLLEVGIVAQCLRYGRDEFSHPLIVRHFPLVVAGTIAVAFATLLAFVIAVDDAIGWYAAFGQNLMMSILFVAMLLRRRSLRGQSMAIAISKLLGTLFAFVLALGWSPPTLHAHWDTLVPDRYTPISPVIAALYAGIFAFDVIYLVLVRRVARSHRLTAAAP